MRSVVLFFLGSCLLGLALGCGSKPTVERPAKPLPPPEHPVFEEVGGGPAPAPAAAPAQKPK
ncbi:MAG: hypothetical protein ABFC96_04440 [Thermoguttaceae bacterium]